MPVSGGTTALGQSAHITGMMTTPDDCPGSCLIDLQSDEGKKKMEKYLSWTLSIGKAANGRISS
jgi:hypothetical protein